MDLSSGRPEPKSVAMSFQQWLQHGESVHQTALQDFQHLAAQRDDLQRRLSAKRAELETMIKMLGKPALENSRRISDSLPQAPTARDADRQVPPVRSNTTYGGQPAIAARQPIISEVGGV